MATKSTEKFKQTIQKYLEEKAEYDPLFEETFKKEGKNIDDCITYILNTVEKSGCNGFTDDEIFSMAIHYYDEDGIDVGKDIDMKVVVNHTVELTEEEIKEAHETAVREVISDSKKKMKSKPTNNLVIVKSPENGVKTENKPTIVQASLF